MDLLPAAIALSTALVVSLLTLQVFERSARGHRVVGARLAPAGFAEVASPGTSVLRPRRGSDSFLAVLPMSRQAHERTAQELVRAGLALRVGEYVALRLAFAALGAVTGLLLVTWLGADAAFTKLLFALVGAIAGWLIPRLYAARQRDRRLEQIEKQLPETLTAMIKALRAGSGLLQALAYATDETPAPLGPELQTALRELQLGAEAEDVFEALKERVGSRDLEVAVTAIVVQRTVGGNLSGILSNVRDTIRERAKIAGEINVLTTRQRLTSNLMAALPILVALAFLGINREMGSLLVNTVVGQTALAFSLVLELVGILLIRRLGMIEV